MLYIIDSGKETDHQLFWVENDLEPEQFSALLRIIRRILPEFGPYFLLGHCKEFIWEDEEEHIKSISPLELVFITRHEREKALATRTETALPEMSRARLNLWSEQAVQEAKIKATVAEVMPRRVMDL